MFSPRALKSPGKVTAIAVKPRDIARAVSAVPVDGKRAYELARKGIAVELPERDVQVQRMPDIPSIPLGRHIQPTADQGTIPGVSRGYSTFWNVQRA